MDASDVMLVSYLIVFIFLVIFLTLRKRKLIHEIIAITEEFPFSGKIVSFFYYAFLIIDIILTITAIIYYISSRYDASYLKGGIIGFILVSILFYSKSLLSVKIGIGGVYTFLTGFINWDKIGSVNFDKKHNRAGFILKTGERFELTLARNRFTKLTEFIESRINLTLEPN